MLNRFLMAFWMLLDPRHCIATLMGRLNVQAKAPPNMGPPLCLATRLEIARELVHREDACCLLIFRHRDGRYSFHHNFDTQMGYPEILRRMAGYYEECHIRDVDYDKIDEEE